ncbi:MAG: tetratricopeptide repeat protein, partial [Terriglobales bacterium]
MLAEQLLACAMMAAVLALTPVSRPKNMGPVAPALTATAAAQARGTAAKAPAGGALQQAQTALDHNDYARAAELLKNYLARHPDSAPANLELGFADAALGHHREAIAAYRAGLKIHPGHFAAQLNLGLLLLADHQPGAALGPFQAAAKLRPTDAKPWFQLGRAQAMRGQPAAAAAAYEKAAALDPGGTAAEYNAGILWLQAGNNA